MLLLGDPRAFWFDIVQIRTLISYLIQNFAPFSKSGLTFRWSFYSGGLGGMVCLFILFSPSSSYFYFKPVGTISIFVFLFIYYLPTLGCKLLKHKGLTSSTPISLAFRHSCCSIKVCSVW